jgi:hypothetical protein
MSSQYKHGHQYDLFVSYSTRDLNWVRAFYDDLIADINRFSQVDVYPFLDKARLQPGHVWNEELLQSVTDSAILVPVFSPRFFDSDYCQKEVNAFLTGNKINVTGLAAGKANRSRIVPVKLLCAAPSDHALAAIQAQSFYAERDGVPYEHLTSSPEYREALRRTAYAIAQTLQDLPPKLQRPAVYVASDFKPHSEKLRVALAHRFDVVPENPLELLGLSPEDLQKLLERDFARCFASVHVLSESPYAAALINEQLEFGKRSAKPHLAWTPGGVAPPELANAGFEYNFSNQAEIEDRVRQIYEKPTESKPGSDCTVYFLCPDRTNKIRAEPLLSALESLGIWTYPSPLDGPAAQAMETHVKALDELDGCLIYYGEVDRDWFDAIFLRVQKTIRKRKLPSAIYPAPPPTDHKKQDLRNLGIPLLDYPNEQQAAQAFAKLLS